MLGSSIDRKFDRSAARVIEEFDGLRLIGRYNEQEERGEGERKERRRTGGERQA